ncbi:MAG: histidinol dehydrogenase [bacterium]|nr:histidinol dehydrogenase [Gammaproteobacteria bacterium]HIL94971.1 histidinol dehydrogenase [Pseudomonadales bacterium]
MIRILDSGVDDFSESVEKLLTIPEENSGGVKAIVQDILDRVKRDGDTAVLELTNKFDNAGASQISDLEVEQSEMRAAAGRIEPLVADALRTSIDRVRKYHIRQKDSLGGQAQWSYEDEDGNRLGQLVRGMERVGVYVPGGKASYPSSVVMTVVPAKVAEVGEIILMVPAPDGELNDVLLAAAYFCGVDRMFKIGGAQAVAALAYGTDLVPRVDKIVGPGNIYVATAKSMVFGEVGIDMIAGPSEVVIVADASADPDWLVMDMFAQAEHDEMAQAIMISTDHDLLKRVAKIVEDTIPKMRRSAIIRQSIEDRGALILVQSENQIIDLVNRIAPEHLEIVVENPAVILAGVRHAGAIFTGRYSAEVIGDYTAGPSHVLPTGGTARFASPLGVYDFQVRSSLIQCTARGAINLSRAAAILAEQEGLEAHAKSAEYRIQG